MNLPVLWQSIRQIWGIVQAAYHNPDGLPSPQTYPGAVRYSLPFRGAWTVVNGGVTQQTSHAWELPSQRYAYDFIQLDAQGCTAPPGQTDVRAFYCYGQDILAPADGVIVQVRDGEPDSPVADSRAVACAARDLRGNHILLRCAEREYALLAHLQPGSIRVRVGQRVLRGQPLAACGNSGNTSEPHLHFQVQAGQSFYAAAGLPIRFADDVTAVPAPGYAQFDPRPLPEGRPGLPYLTRGQRVTQPEISLAPEK